MKKRNGKRLHKEIGKTNQMEQIIKRGGKQTDKRETGETERGERKTGERRQL